MFDSEGFHALSIDVDMWDTWDKELDTFGYKKSYIPTYSHSMLDRNSINVVYPCVESIIPSMG